MTQFEAICRLIRLEMEDWDYEGDDEAGTIVEGSYEILSARIARQLIALGIIKIAKD